MSTPQQKNRPRLGRGLSSLINVSDLPVEADLPSQPPSTTPMAPASAPALAAPAVHPHQDGRALDIPIDAISPNPHQPRRSMDEAKIAELAASLKSTGLIQPVIVRKQGAGYQLIAGERRWRAAKLAGMTALPALVREVDSLTQAQMALIENIQREDLNSIDRAAGYRTLIDQLGLTQAELAGRMGEDRSSIANYLRLLDLAEPAKQMVSNGQLSMGHAKLIAGLPDVLEQERLANLVVAQGLSVRNLERLLQDGPPAAAPRAEAPAPSPHIQDLEKSIARQLGMRVQVRTSAKKGRGKLIIHYSSLDQFDELMSRMGVQTEQ